MTILCYGPVKTKLKYYGFFWVTLGLFITSISLHWLFAWYSYVQEQNEHNQPIELNDYFNETFRDTLLISLAIFEGPEKPNTTQSSQAF